MTMGAHSQWQKRETRRAELLHKIFTRVAKMGLTYRRMFSQARKLAGSGRFLKSYARFECLFLAWKESPCPETLRRKWSPWQRESTARVVREVELLAVAGRVTLREAYGRISPPLTYLTVFRHSKIRPQIARLAAIRRSRERLATEEKHLVNKITGRKRP
jgi:hypothetical protein